MKRGAEHSSGPPEFANSWDETPRSFSSIPTHPQIKGSRIKNRPTIAACAGRP